ncbi:FKBP-type peptidyl-prolyl cis-trans isomerase [Sunxiuqinia elliptica]|uniref:Peptidyl-prolyl cis-trans isomerase n=1 Tax=Sunxiuqinia elliptica TaxID=655355 RepID=A0A1I2JZ60_9BACT|nr:FKBP-type peptidyl-prolyl cis-trans isomerase [Sunxiuqinia elliptica]SFF59874.1 FKBP-type peptidyl-prolyl cis-trans isomerase [Sunxiuqinia elliptica]
MKKTFFLIVSVVAIIAISVSCKDNGLDLEKLRAEEIQKLEEFIEKNDIQEEPTASGLYYIEREKGTGDTIKNGDRVKIFYTGMLIDSTVFDMSGTYEPFDFIVGGSGVIAGMSEGVTHMRQGGKGTLIIPSELAYGASSSQGLPRFSTLIFDIEIKNHYKLSTEDTEE